MSAEIIQFVPRARTSRPSERLRMIAEARAQYQAIFPDDPTLGHVVDTAPSEVNPDNNAI